MIKTEFIDTVLQFLGYQQYHFLVSSFPQSVAGYLVCSLRCLLGYQMKANSWIRVIGTSVLGVAVILCL